MKVTSENNDRPIRYIGDTTGLPNSAQVPADSEIWSRFKQGEESAFVHIYQTFFHQLFRYGHQFTGDTGLVEDCIQEVFIHLRKKRANLGDTNSIKFYLYKALRSKILRILSSKSKMFVSSNLLEGYNFQLNLSHETLLIKNQIDEDTRIALKKALNTLTPRQREVIIYYFYEKMTYQEISEIMEFSKVKYSRDLLYRAIDKLKAEMGGTNSGFFYTLLFLVFANK